MTRKRHHCLSWYFSMVFCLLSESEINTMNVYIFPVLKEGELHNVQNYVEVKDFANDQSYDIYYERGKIIETRYVCYSPIHY